MKFISFFLLVIFLASCSSFSGAPKSVRGPYAVNGEGDTEAQAREDGFRVAVGIAMGTAVRSERIVKDDEVALNYVLTHSSGYVDRAEIKSVSKDGERFRVSMNVFIKPTLVDDYVLYSAKSTESIDGENLSFGIKSREEEFRRGDDFLNSILKDYPSKAVEIRQGSFSVVIDENRKKTVEVNFSYRFSPLYLKSLSQGIRQIDKGNASYGTPSITLIYNQLVYFDRHALGDRHQFHDSVRFSLVKNRLLEPYHFQVIFKSNLDEVLATTCLKTRYRLSESRKNSLGQSAWHQGCSECMVDDIWIYERWNIPLDVSRNKTAALSKNIDQLSSFSIEIKPKNQCL